MACFVEFLDSVFGFALRSLKLGYNSIFFFFIFHLLWAWNKTSIKIYICFIVCVQSFRWIIALFAVTFVVSCVYECEIPSQPIPIPIPQASVKCLTSDRGPSVSSAGPPLSVARYCAREWSDVSKDSRLWRSTCRTLRNDTAARQCEYVDVWLDPTFLRMLGRRIDRRTVARRCAFGRAAWDSPSSVRTFRRMGKRSADLDSFRPRQHAGSSRWTPPVGSTPANGDVEWTQRWSNCSTSDSSKTM